jgi:hypothetical protein
MFQSHPADRARPRPGLPHLRMHGASIDRAVPTLWPPVGTDFGRCCRARRMMVAMRATFCLPGCSRADQGHAACRACVGVMLAEIGMQRTGLGTGAVI